MSFNVNTESSEALSLTLLSLNSTPQTVVLDLRAARTFSATGAARIEEAARRQMKRDLKEGILKSWLAGMVVCYEQGCREDTTRVSKGS